MLYVTLEPFGHSGGTREKRAMSRDSGTWRVTHLSCVDGSNPIHGDGAHTLSTVVPTCTSEPPAGQPKGLIEPVNKTVSNPDKKYHRARALPSICNKVSAEPLGTRCDGSAVCSAPYSNSVVLILLAGRSRDFGRRDPR
jgi:hypothetical protein